VLGKPKFTWSLSPQDRLQEVHDEGNDTTVRLSCAGEVASQKPGIGALGHPLARIMLPTLLLTRSGRRYWRLAIP
jgi:hypothetical protein